MRACVIHAAKDLRVEDRPETDLEPEQVRLSFGYGGICGSDLHYVAEGRVGDSIVRDPMVLGHEFSGRVLEVGSAVTDLQPGEQVVVNPSLHCGECRYCRSGRTNLCQNMRYLGSAAKRPHQNGGFVERPVVHRRQCVKIPAQADLRLAALAEPYAIALHAVRRGGDLTGRKVLVTGAGTIGTLIAIAARRAGAAEIVVTDITDAPLRRVREMVADQVINVATEAEAVAALTDAKDIDVAIEASGASAGLEMAVQAAAPGGRIVQVGFLPPSGRLSINGLLTKELDLVGAYRFEDEFNDAVAEIVEGKVDLSWVVTGDYPVDRLDEAFEVAADRNRSLKVLIHF
ncbi:L-idonate 5-dehydrogenase [Telmatospirillum sp. J64-1]|uniref:L-idonate 5-dehydrogenase n=1 Tax=Telmatospirillum sp. J64-1 TaxID=2502183 RepID=UPI00115F5B41|nr:L-idonate 5-dehydrogenase [Telmatospirillum sp. J64-1]